jgi:hypothetical protein
MKLMKLKYHLNVVEFDEKTEVYTLIQRVTTLSDFEQLYGEPKIISYNTDLLEEDKEDDLEVKNKRSKKKQASAKPKKELTQKQQITLRVKNNGPIDWGNSDEDEDEDDDEK